MNRDETLQLISDIRDAANHADLDLLNNDSHSFEHVRGWLGQIELIVSTALDDYERSQAQKENEENGQTQAIDPSHTGHAQ
jgi:hypothetical protein